MPHYSLFSKHTCARRSPLLRQESYDRSAESNVSFLVSGSPVTACDEEPHSSRESVATHLFYKKDLNDLVRDLRLNKDKSQILASRLQQRNLAQKGVNFTHFRTRHSILQDYFTVQDNVCYCSKIDGLFESQDADHGAATWRLFVDSNTVSLKAVLSHNRNERPFVPLMHIVEWNLINNSNYDASGAVVKAISFLAMKRQCILCCWDSSELRWWPLLSQRGMARVPRVYSTSIISLWLINKKNLPPMHIKLRSFKKFAKPWDQTGAEFTYLHQKFPS